MKKNIILLYMVYGVIIYLLLVIDITVLIYYIFWINNIFIYPLLWLMMKIIFFNRTVLLLLFFYYLIAKYTIKEDGYKYFFFFNIDIRKWRSIYLNYIWNITTYHIEIISIYLFFFVIMMPLYFYNKQLIFLVLILFLFFFIFFKIKKNKLNYLKKKNYENEQKLKLKNYILYPLLLLIFFKIFNYQYIKDITTLYLHFDIWTFNLLEWKIQMYNKNTEKDYYAETVGLKPIWIGEKFNKKDYINNKLWEHLCKKKKYKLINEYKLKFKKIKKKSYIIFKNYEKYLKIKKKILYIKKKTLFRELKYNKIKFNKESSKNLSKEIVLKHRIKNENPVVAQEKERERFLHRTFVPTKVLNFSFENYYHLNFLLKNLTLDKLYYQPFYDKKGMEKYLINQKKSEFHTHTKSHLNKKEDLILYKGYINEIKKNKIFLKKTKMQISSSLKNSNLVQNKNDLFIFNKLLNYIMIKSDFKSNDLLKIKMIFNKIKSYDVKFYKKKEKLNMNIFLKKIKNDIIIKNKINKLSFLHDSKKIILVKDKIKEVKKKSYNLTSNYIEKSELERFDNKILFNTVKKYNEEKKKPNWNNEFNKSFILKKKKENLRSADSPDLSRRNRK